MPDKHPVAPRAARRRRPAPAADPLVELTVRVAESFRCEARLHAISERMSLGALVIRALRSRAIVRHLIHGAVDRVAMRTRAGRAPPARRNGAVQTEPVDRRVEMTVRVPLSLRRELHDWAQAAELTMGEFVVQALRAVLPAGSANGSTRGTLRP